MQLEFADREREFLSELTDIRSKMTFSSGIEKLKMIKQIADIRKELTRIRNYVPNNYYHDWDTNYFIKTKDALIKLGWRMASDGVTMINSNSTHALKIVGRPGSIKDWKLYRIYKNGQWRPIKQYWGGKLTTPSEMAKYMDKSSKQPIKH